MANGCDCCCNKPLTLIFPCSGGSDVGEVADRVARRLTCDGKGKMYCLAGIGGRVSGIVKTTEAATAILAIDGCPLDCASNCLKQAGFTDFDHLRVTDLGLAKEQTPVTEKSISMVIQETTRILTALEEQQEAD